MTMFVISAHPIGRMVDDILLSHLHLSHEYLNLISPGAPTTGRIRGYVVHIREFTMIRVRMLCHWFHMPTGAVHVQGNSMASTTPQNASSVPSPR